MDKFCFIDIGELGWSMYLSFHLKWLKIHSDCKISVITSPDRECLYKGLSDKIIYVPKEFYIRFKGHHQSCFGIRSKKQVNDYVLKSFFKNFVPDGYRIPNYISLSCQSIKSLKNTKFHYSSYSYDAKLKGKKEIVIFPRFRKGLNRNIPKGFYSDLINNLCDSFPNLIIRTIGLENGAYKIICNKSNFRDGIVKSGSLQNLIDKCQVMIGAIGSQSAPPKITLLQGVPTYMIGHQKKRHQETENWMKTKCGFFEINQKGYSTFRNKNCIKAIIKFFREVEKNV